MAVDLVPQLPVPEMTGRASSDVISSEEIYIRYLSARTPGSAADNYVVRDLAGDLYENMVINPRDVAMSLDHPDPNVRIAGLLLLRDYWPPRDWLTAICVRVALYDPIPQVRGVALRTLLALSNEIVDASGFLRDLSIILKLRELPPSFVGHSIPPTSRVTPLSDQAQNTLPLLTSEEARVYLQHISDDNLNDMLSDRDVTLRYLVDINPELRWASLFILTRCWPLDHSLADLCEQLLVTEDNIIVRQVAIEALATCYAKTDNARVGSRLAQIVNDVEQPTLVRQAAYEGLFIIRGMPVTLWPTLLRMKRKFTFPEDVNWRFVKSFLL